MTTYHLALDKIFLPYSAILIEYESFIFSGGEPHIKIKTDLKEGDKVYISHRLNNFADLGLLCIAVDALRRIGIEHIEAFIPYFPAARQDRVMIAGEPLTVKVYADIFNQLGLKKLTIFDPHSEVTPALLQGVKVVYNFHFIQNVLSHINSEVRLVSPDGGALKKIYKLAETIGHQNIVECSKHRNVITGQLADFKVSLEDLEGADCLVVDDICDGGGTFIGLAEELKKHNAGKLYLAVSHGIFSKGVDSLISYYDGIYCTDSIRNAEHEKVVQIKLKL